MGCFLKTACFSSNVIKVNKMRIVTNNKPRDIVSFFELKEKYQKEMLETYGEDAKELQFFTYKNDVYCLADFCVVDKKGHLSYWDATLGTSYFSSLLIRLTNCNNAVIVGRAYW